MHSFDLHIEAAHYRCHALIDLPCFACGIGAACLDYPAAHLAQGAYLSFCRIAMRSQFDGLWIFSQVVINAYAVFPSAFKFVFNLVSALDVLVELAGLTGGACSASVQSAKKRDLVRRQFVARERRSDCR